MKRLVFKMYIEGDEKNSVGIMADKDLCYRNLKNKKYEKMLNSMALDILKSLLLGYEKTTTDK